MAYLNGQLVPLDKARMPALDFGYFYGYGVFETFQAYHGAVFRLDRHLQRLAEGCADLGLPDATHLDDLSAAIAKTLLANDLKDARVRITVSLQGEEPLPQLPSQRQVNVLVTAIPAAAPSRETYEKGYSAIISPIRRNSTSPLARLKALGFAEQLLARQQARQKGADEALFLNESGMLACASTANLFLVINERLLTPSKDCGIRAGVTRETVLELASQHRLPATEGPLQLRDLSRADEAFLTNSILEIMPLTHVEGRPIGQGKPGPVTQRVRQAYKRLVKEETARAITEPR
jgi:branched-chain amino acid aminotransferase